MKERIKYFCLICNLHKFSEKKLRKHMKEAHKGAELHACHCGKVYNRREAYEDHINKFHSHQKTYKCERGCNQEFFTQVSRRIHCRQFHKDFMISCTISGCTGTFKLSASLKKHIRENHELVAESESH